jgi:hypothetical protein
MHQPATKASHPSLSPGPTVRVLMVTRGHNGFISQTIDSAQSQRMEIACDTPTRQVMLDRSRASDRQPDDGMRRRRA